MKNKYYAIRYLNGSQEILEKWDDCKKKTSENSSAIYKGFKEESDAEAWLQKKFPEAYIESSLTADIQLYVDGSYLNNLGNRAGWGWVAVQNGKLIQTGSGVTLGKAESRNIDGELLSAIEAALWWKRNQDQFPNADLIFDCDSIGNLAVGAWEASKDTSKNFVAFIKEELEGDIQSDNLKFFNLKGHTGIHWNELADRLAKEAIYFNGLKTVPNGEAFKQSYLKKALELLKKPHNIL